MSHQVVWSKIILEEFIKLAILTKDEEIIMRTRVDGWSVVKQAQTFNMSTSTVNRIIKRLKVKYDEVQKYSPILPPRKFSAAELYLDKKGMK